MEEDLAGGEVMARLERLGIQVHSFSLFLGPLFFLQAGFLTRDQKSMNTHKA